MKTIKCLMAVVCVGIVGVIYGANGNGNGSGNGSNATTSGSGTTIVVGGSPTISSSGMGGFLLAAPGVATGSLVEVRAPFTTSKNLGRYYKYIFRGIETKGATTGAPGNSANANGGILHIWAGVNGEDSAKITFRDELEYNNSPVITNIITPITYKEQNITVNWKGNGNAHAPNGYVTILGEGITDPKTPKGSLNIKQFAVANTTFRLGWTVLRDY